MLAFCRTQCYEELCDSTGYAETPSSSDNSVVARQAWLQEGIALPLGSEAVCGADFVGLLTDFQAAVFYPFVKEYNTELSLLVEAKANDVFKGLQT